MVADLRCAVLTRHPLSDAQIASLAPYSIFPVRARWQNAREAWLDACYACESYFPDLIVLIMPPNWACWFVDYVGGMSPQTVIIRPVMDGRDRWMGRWTRQRMENRKMRYSWWPET